MHNLANIHMLPISIHLRVDGILIRNRIRVPRCFNLLSRVWSLCILWYLCACFAWSIDTTDLETDDEQSRGSLRHLRLSGISNRACMTDPLVCLQALYETNFPLISPVLWNVSQLDRRRRDKWQMLRVGGTHPLIDLTQRFLVEEL